MDIWMVCMNLSYPLRLHRLTLDVVPRSVQHNAFVNTPVLVLFCFGCPMGFFFLTCFCFSSAPPPIEVTFILLFVRCCVQVGILKEFMEMNLDEDFENDFGNPDGMKM